MNPVSVIMPQDGDINTAPTYLFDHSDLYKQDPREAALAWFREASYGLGVHYGLYSLIGKGERALMAGALTEEEYHALPKLLKANHFEANDIVEFAIANGMRYLNFNVRNADGFSLTIKPRSVTVNTSTTHIMTTKTITKNATRRDSFLLNITAIANSTRNDTIIFSRFIFTVLTALAGITKRSSHSGAFSPRR